MKSKNEVLVEGLRERPYQRELVFSVSGVSMLAWCDRQGTVRLTKVGEESKLALRDKTSGGAGT